jgi:hypothetical protein
MQQLLKNALATFLIVLLTPIVLFAQQPTSDWSVIEKLKPGAKIIVLTRNGREYVGEKRQSTDDTVFMETRFTVQGTRTISLSRDEIGEVRKRKTRWVFPLIGAAIGVGIGLGFGANVDRRGGDDPGLGKLLFAPLGGLIGFAGGSFVPRKSKTIYTAP